MTSYEEIVQKEIQMWKKKQLQNPHLMKRMSKNVQNKINSVIPQKIHQAITVAIKAFIKSILTGASVLSRQAAAPSTLFEQDQLFREKLATYQKAAVAEGAGTGFGGILLGIADFPLLLSIKMKFLYETAAVYGYNPHQYEERLFLLHIFQLAFSNTEKRRETLEVIENWEIYKHAILDMDWQVFQQEYRDYIDLAKLLQLIPGFGAIVGAYANHNLMEQLGETAMNAYRMRALHSIGS
ncbi:EcsC family protein [Aciduricibacillus chroicocephali]|uniref:EcsC family protein n=1 Tax=Aciduricibacillus chroicocephali TaxID=3054939 RepID=A0ABY9KWU6_9BACI|nr:EcsC family protein [Bacillaceae bacterium 44XB]